MTIKLPPAVQHAALVLVTALLAWAAQGLSTTDGLPPGAREVAGAFIAWLIGYAVPLFDTYGLRRPDATPDDPAAGV